MPLAGSFGDKGSPLEKVVDAPVSSAVISGGVLQLTGCTEVGDDGVRALLHSCTGLQVLRIAGIRGVREMSLMHLSKCSQLHTLVRLRCRHPESS